MSLYRRPNSPYFWTEIEVGGRRVRRSTGKPSRRDAEQFERQLRDELRLAAKAERQRPQIAAEQITLDQACGKYWIDHGRRLRAARDEKRNLGYILEAIGAERTLAEISNADVNTLKNFRVAQGAGPAGVNRTITTLKTMHNRAAKVWEMPVRVIEWKRHMLKEPKERVRYLTVPEAKLLIERLTELAPHIAVLVEFLLQTGLRKAEAFNATWDKFNGTAGVLTVKVKGGHWREVALSADSMALISALPRHGRYVFDTTNWRKHFDRALALCQISDFHWHDLRHTHATWLGQGGAKLEVVQKSLGHSSITVTMKYRHVAQREVREALANMPQLTRNTGNVRPLRKNGD